jgi:putative tryptophan/tyrosine transport system substrate-binding protein
MKRREFISLLGGAAAASSVSWPLGLSAQQPDRVRRVGWLDLVPASDPGAQARVAAFQQSLAKLGWTVGRNLAIDYCWGAFNLEAAQLAVAELLGFAPEVILCAGTPAVQALQQAARSIPIVFILVAEPVAQGFVQSLARPGGNITGFSYMEPSVGAKWLDLLKEIAPRVTRIAFIFNPDASPYSQLWYRSIETAASKFSVETASVGVRDLAGIEEVMTRLGNEPGGGLIFTADAFILSNRKALIELAARYRLPAIYGIPHRAEEGSLIYYCVDTLDQYRSAVAYVDRILRGEKPSDLPVQQPTKFSLGINLKAASALGLTVPQTLQVAADEIAE